MATTIYEPLLPVPGFDIRDFRRLPGEPVAVETHGGRTIVREKTHPENDSVRDYNPGSEKRLRIEHPK